ncbi:hypothetical protein AB7M17_007182 [Bradyrhizobium sp. USDA 377]
MAIDPHKQLALYNLYSDLMTEVRYRVDYVGAAARREYNLPKMAAYEFCYLQFRLICETIALASLAAHGDIPATKSGKLKKTYQADAILNKLDVLHPAFYPTPLKEIRDENGNALRFEETKAGFLTKKELIALYHETGNTLHRGTMRDLKPLRSGDFEEILRTMKKIVKLLNCHRIQLSDPNYQLRVLLKVATDDKVHTLVMKRPAQP